MKKILFALAALLLPLSALAVQISVPSAPGAGYGLSSVSTGQYVASTTSPLIAGSNITFTGGTPYVFGPSVTISASGGSGTFPFTPFVGFNATTTALAFPGFISSASSTISYLGSGLVGSNNGRLYSLSTSTLSASISGNAATATALATGRTIGITGDITYTSPSFDGSGNVTAAGTLATVNGNVGSFTNASFTVNAKGLITAASSGSAGTASSTLLQLDTNTYSFPQFFSATTTHTAVTINAAQSSASISSGGAFRCLNTNNDGTCSLLYTNHGAGANGRLSVINNDNVAFDQNVLYIRSQSQTTTAVNIQGAPNGQGLLKLDIGTGGNTGNNNTALLSCDTTDHTSYAQCAFFKGNSATTTAILYAVDASSNTAFKVDGNRLSTFIWASSTALSATSLCLGTDCRTAWPSSVGSGLATSSPTSAGNLLAYTATGAGSAYGVATTSATINNGLTGTLTTIGSGQTIGLATINAGVLGGVTNGSVPTSQATSTLYGNGVGGQILAWNNGQLMFVATSSIQNITLTTTGTSGAATLTGNVLNIPQYSGGGSTFSFTPSSYNGVANNATTTGLMALPTSGYGLIASSTFTTYASTTNFSSSGDTWLATSGSNKVGIGTTSPSSLLSIDGGSGPNSLRVCQGAGNSCVQFGFTASGNQAATVGTLSNAGMFFMTNGVNRLAISNSGLIGIGTTTSQWPLEIVSATKPQLDLFDGGIVDSNHWTFRSINGNLFIATSTFAATSTVSALSIDTNGNVSLARALTIGTGITAVNATSTGTQAIPFSASASTPVAGTIAIDSTTGQLRFSDVTGTTRVISEQRDLGFAYATTSWGTTATTTIRIGPAPANITVNAAYCETNVGTVGVSLTDAVPNRANYIPTASTTINKNFYTTNNSFTAGESMRVDLGTPASSPTNVSCRLLYTYDQD